MKRVLVTLGLWSIVFVSQASHIIGGEIRYEHISGNQYEVFVNLYGDCAGASYPDLLNNATGVEVTVYDGGTLVRSIVCSKYGDFGKEITPVCPADSNNTSCRGGTIQGVSEFPFKGQVTINSGTNWRFVFAGNIIGGVGAGRTAAITNANTTSQNGSIIYLEAFLNNSNAPNNSPVLTTIPTPFFCINQPQEYNVGAADADGDLLSFSLQDALEPSNLGGSISVGYYPPYSGAQPLAASAFNFNGTNGQLSFTPNLTQISLVVNKIEEYRNGVLVGSMMREMNFIVLNNCSNQSPDGSIDSFSAGKLLGPNEIQVCNADSVINFTIASSDPDSSNVNAIVTGLPNGLSYTINNNNTQNPSIDFSFVIPQPMIDGTTYSFFVTFQDDSCPLSSKQQIAYNVKVVNPITSAPTVINESCLPGGDGIINVTASSINSDVLYSFNGGPLQANNTFTNLSAGNYSVLVRDSIGCFFNNPIVLDTATKVYIDTPLTTDISCFSKSDGQIEVGSTPLSLATSYTLLPSNISSTAGKFSNLPVGIYTLIVDAPFGCSDTTSVSLTSPPDISFQNIQITDNRCDLRTGRIEIGSNITTPVEYSISPNQQTNSYGSFGGLIAGYYIITVQDTNGCNKDTILKVNDNPIQMLSSMSKQDVSCEGNGNDGWASVTVTGGVSPYTYRWESNLGTEGNTATILNQRSGIKRVFVTDAIGCSLDNYIFVDPANCCEKVFIPTAFSPNGDGQNDKFRIRTPLTMNDVKLIVANRWGQIIWQTDNHLDGWDGNYQSSGTPADIGTYYYFLRYKCAEGEGIYKLKGDVTIVR